MPKSPVPERNLELVVVELAVVVRVEEVESLSDLGLTRCNGDPPTRDARCGKFEMRTAVVVDCKKGRSNAIWETDLR